MEKINTPLMQLIEWIQENEIRMPAQQRIVEKAKSLIPTERKAIEEAHRSGQRDQGKVNKQWCRDYFTKTFKSYE